MDWLNNYFNQEPFSLVIPVIIIVGIFFYAARRAHLNHLERIKKIDESYHIQTSSKITYHRH
jgi:hypothetical protein